MAKRRSGESVEAAALDFAEDLGRLLGTAERKANEWMSQRQAVTKNLTALRDKANQLLEALGESGVRPVRRGRPTAKAKTAEELGMVAKRKRSNMTAAARKAVGDRMRKYWAARRKAEGRA